MLPRRHRMHARRLAAAEGLIMNEALAKKKIKHLCDVAESIF
jgi:hypothetical protein